MNPTNYITVLQGIIESTVGSIPGTMDIEYVIAPSTLIVADAQGNPQPTLVYILSISIPSLSVGEMLTAPATIPSSRPSEEQVVEATRMLIESLMNERDRLARETMEKADQALLTGAHLLR